VHQGLIFPAARVNTDRSNHWYSRPACECDSPDWRWIPILTFHVESHAKRAWVDISTVTYNRCAGQTYKSAFACRTCFCCLQISDFLDEVNTDEIFVSTLYRTPTECDMCGTPVPPGLTSYGIARPGSVLAKHWRFLDRPLAVRETFLTGCGQD